MHILSFADNADIFANLHAYLAPRGYVIDSATNGYACQLAAQHDHDVVIPDVTLWNINKQISA